MSGFPEREPLDMLTAADPVDADHLSSASLARIRARVSEDVMTTDHARRGLARRPLMAFGGLGAGIAAVALVLVIARPGAAPVTTPTAIPGPGSAACVEPYSGPASVAERGIAFDGTVTAIDGDDVTFSVNDGFQGVSDATITLAATGMTGTTITSAGGPNLAVGGRYLVAGEDRFVWACGYTQAYDPAVAAQWAAATGG
jgi:hypothetical protein